MTFVDVAFTLAGRTIPVDHGYHLLSAVSKHIPNIHSNESVGIRTISGRLNRDRTCELTDNSRLSIRIAADNVSSVIPLAGKTIELGGSRVIVGTPVIQALLPTARLYSRLVVIKGFTEPDPFLDAAKRQLKELGIKAAPFLVSTEVFAKQNEGSTSGTKSPWLRRTLKIRDKIIVGFALNVEGLTAEESILLQENGLGGRRRFGCGIFLPARV